MDREQPAFFWGLDNFTARDRRQVQVATHQMQVVARQQNDVADSEHEVFAILAVNPDMELALDNVVIKNHVRRWPERRRAVLWSHAGSHTPWRSEIGVQEHAAGQMRHSENVG